MSAGRGYATTNPEGSSSETEKVPRWCGIDNLKILSQASNAASQSHPDQKLQLMQALRIAECLPGILGAKPIGPFFSPTTML